MKKITQGTLLVLLSLLVTSCTNKVTKPVTPPAPPKVVCDCPVEKPPVQIPESSKPAEIKPPDAKVPEYSLLKSSQWDEVDGLQLDNLSQAWPAWMQSCST